jgi:hypothetical protein
MTTALTAPAPASKETARRARPHDADEASIGLCDCAGCLAERTRRRTDPLLAAALAALYDVGDLLHMLRRSHGCDPARCPLCHEAYMAWMVLGQLECGLEGEYSFPRDPKLAARRADSARVRSDSARRSPRPWRPGCGQNHPVHPLAVVVLIDLGRALEALREGHACHEDDCYVCGQAAVAAWLLPAITATIEETLIPEPAILAKRGVGPGGAKLLRLLKTGGRRG